jgi:hypothetical protein
MSAQSRFWAFALGAGVLSGAMYCAMTIRPQAGLPLLYVAHFPLFVAGLAMGATATAIAGAAATLMVALRSIDLALFLVAVFFVPTVVLVRQALLSRQAADGTIEWYPPGLLTGWLVALGLAGLALAGLILAIQGGIEAYARVVAGWSADFIAHIVREPMAPDERMKAIDNMSAQLLGLAVAMLMFVTAVNGVLAQGLLMRFGLNRRPAPDMASLDLPPVLPVLLVGFVLLGWLLPGDLGYLARNALPVILFGGLLGGLAVAHAAVRRIEGKRWMLVVIYLVAGMGLPMFVLVSLGLAEPFLKLKRRMLRNA